MEMNVHSDLRSSASSSLWICYMDISSRILWHNQIQYAVYPLSNPKMEVAPFSYGQIT